MNDDHQPLDAKSVDAIMKLAGAMPRAVQPERDLWPAIAQTINEGERLGGAGPRWPRLFAQAAAVLLLVGASSGLTWLAMQDRTAPDTLTASSQGLTFQPVSGSFGSQYMLGPDYQDARDELLARTDVELARLSPETRALVEQNMLTIRSAIDEINKALAAQPDNALLQELLINSYREELKILRQVDSIAGSVMRRTDI
ncbi:MAG: hypothetical protein WBN23_03750 [Woeseia sp.]